MKPVISTAKGPKPKMVTEGICLLSLWPDPLQVTLMEFSFATTETAATRPPISQEYLSKVGWLKDRISVGTYSV